MLWLDCQRAVNISIENTSISDTIPTEHRKGLTTDNDTYCLSGDSCRPLSYSQSGRIRLYFSWKSSNNLLAARKSSKSLAFATLKVSSLSA